MRNLIALAGVALLAGCSALPDISYEPQYHNPFPQLHRIAILPFANLSENPYVDGEKVALAYYNELQQIPGFEVMPIGVVKRRLEAMQLEPDEATDFQRIAQQLNVDAVIIGAVTDYTPYYPPRLGLAVRWYAANRGFHPIPPGYGLPWGTPEEEYIPERLVHEAEFALAREQLATQTPQSPETHRQLAEQQTVSATSADECVPDALAMSEGLPPNWPDPSGLIPPEPSAEPPPYRPQYEPIIRHTRTYNGHDEDFTSRLADYYYFRDDARFGGWQSYLQRSDDFIRFCCYLHLTETLAARGGTREPRVVWRWPISRYER